MSQHESTGLESRSFTIRLRSFGHCYAADNSPVPSRYTVIQSQTLTACFDTSFTQCYAGTFSREHRLRIADGTKLLDDINLNVLGEAVRTAAEDTRISGSKPRTYVCEQCPIIAMRYPVSHDKLRKFQFRTEERKDFYEALKFFSLAGVVVQPASQNPKKRHSYIASQPNASQAVLGGSTQQSISNKQHTPTLSEYREEHRISDQPNDNRQVATNPNHPLQLPSRAPAGDGYTPNSASPNRWNVPMPGSNPEKVHKGHNTDSFGEPRSGIASTAPVRIATPLTFGLPPQRELPFQMSGRKLASSNPVRSEPISALPKKVLESPPKAKAPFSTRLETTDTPLSELRNEKPVERRSAKDIDTQLLLSKVADRKIRSDSKLSIPIKIRPVENTVQSTSKDVSSQIKAHNYRCDSCRKSHRKCDKIVDDSSQRCRPCLQSGKECTYELLSRLKSFSRVSASTQLSRGVIASQNEHQSQRNTGMIPRSQSRALSDLSQVLASRKTVSAGAVGIKRKAESAVNENVKRSKTMETRIEHDLSRQPQKSQGLREPVRPSAQVPTRTSKTIVLPQMHALQSDATTMTADSADLDPPVAGRRSFIKANTKAVKSKLTSDCPTYSELSEQHDPVQNRAPVTLDAHPDSAAVSPHDHACPTRVSTPVAEADRNQVNDRLCKGSLSEFSKLPDETKNEYLDDFIREAILSDDFLALCKMLDRRWQAQLVTNRI